MPCLKPISLNEKILTLFKTPNPQKICYPFAGTFSEIIGGWKAGFTDFIACEINEKYIQIGQARFDYWTKQKTGDKVKLSKEAKKENEAEKKEDNIIQGELF